MKKFIRLFVFIKYLFFISFLQAQEINFRNSICQLHEKRKSYDENNNLINIEYVLKFIAPSDTILYLRKSIMNQIEENKELYFTSFFESYKFDRYLILNESDSLRIISMYEVASLNYNEKPIKYKLKKGTEIYLYFNFVVVKNFINVYLKEKDLSKFDSKNCKIAIHYSFPYHNFMTDLYFSDTVNLNEKFK